MESLVAVAASALTSTARALWSLPLIPLILFVGILLTVRVGAPRSRLLGKAIRFMVKLRHGETGESISLSAMCSALTATVGVGNIVGISLGMVVGGPGVLFWVWIAALVGLATRYSEALLSVKYRSLNPSTGRVLGGPFYYIERGLGPKWRWLAKLFAFFGVCAGLFGIGALTQSSAAVTAVTAFFDPEASATICLQRLGTHSAALVVSSVCLAALVGVVIIGKKRRVTRIAGRISAVMAVVYVVAALVLVLFNIGKLPGAIVSVFEYAFGMRAIAGSALATMFMALQMGFARGVFSSEAGLGSAPILAAAARAKEPVRQGLIALSGMFLDAIVVCTLTGLALIMTGAWQNPPLEGVLATTTAFQLGLPFLPADLVAFVLMACLVVFGFTAILRWGYFSERCLEYFFDGNPLACGLFRWIYVAAVLVAPFLTVSGVWAAADLFNGLLALPNLVALIALSGVVTKETRDYFIRLKDVKSERDASQMDASGRADWNIPPLEALEDDGD